MTTLANVGIVSAITGLALVLPWALLESRGDARWRAAGYGFILFFAGLAAIAVFAVIALAVAVCMVL